MRRRSETGNWLWYTKRIAIVAVILLVPIAVQVAPHIIPFVRVQYEYISYKQNPSAERAYAYAQRHFDARDRTAYDFRAASYFFREALFLDPGLPYVNHQLARVEFLQGNFDAAMIFINAQIERQGDKSPSSYYVRGLIEGYMGKYADAVTDYHHYLQFDPDNWAALNDYAWVLIKAERYDEAVHTTDQGLKHFPDNPWLLNSKAIALYELKRYDEALQAAERASVVVGNVTEQQWLTAYPGNDPRVAAQGIETLRTSVADNVHRVQAKIAGGALE